MQPLFETERLSLREFTPDDAPFVLQLLNDPDWHRFIGDRGIRTEGGAREYLVNGPIAMYATRGFGLWRVALKADDTPIGMCGLIKRDTLEYVDIGFAYMPAFRGQGYALEAAQATLDFGRDQLGLKRILGITAPDNEPSIALLEKIGLRFDRTIPSLRGEGESKQFAVDFE
jgi:RimJ/RimL family protein N-acetyltransferase